MQQHDDLGPGPLVAIVGSIDPDRQDYDPPLKNLDQADQAAEDVGRALAEAGFRMVVYSGEADFLEALVVRGYVASGKATENSIEVWHRVNHPAGRFAEQNDHGSLFEAHPDNSSSWEGSFYRSLGKVNGIVLIGGGRSTLIAGHVALGFKLPILAVATFGGKAGEIWGALDSAELAANRTARNVMAPAQWTKASAKACVDALVGILAAKREQQAESLEHEAQRMRSMNRNATITMALLVATFVTLPIGWLLRGLDPVWFLSLVFLAPILAGACGSTISTLRPAPAQRPGAERTPPQRVTVTLGSAAGALSALLYLLAQLAANPNLFDSANVPFLVLPYAVLIGVGGGLASERVYSRLETEDPLKPEGVTSDQSS